MSTNENEDDKITSEGQDKPVIKYGPALCLDCQHQLRWHNSYIDLDTGLCTIHKETEYSPVTGHHEYLVSCGNRNHDGNCPYYERMVKKQKPANVDSLIDVIQKLFRRKQNGKEVA